MLRILKTKRVVFKAIHGDYEYFKKRNLIDVLNVGVVIESVTG
jgi:predicted protein tyrosine phosphatase